jgi:hypothetical protein
VDVNTTLPSGATLTGEFSAWMNGAGYSADSATYRIPLAASIPASNIEFLDPGATSASCPGPGNAASGHLCIYAGSIDGGTTFAHPFGFDGFSASDAFGFHIYFDTAGSGAHFAYGTWSVTAP